MVFWNSSDTGILEFFRHCGILELFRHCGILEFFRHCGILEFFRNCGILEFFRHWYFGILPTLCYFGILPTLWYYLLLISFPLIKQAVNSSDMCTMTSMTTTVTPGTKILVYNVCIYDKYRDDKLYLIFTKIQSN